MVERRWRVVAMFGFVALVAGVALSIGDCITDVEEAEAEEVAAAAVERARAERHEKRLEARAERNRAFCRQSCEALGMRTLAYHTRRVEGLGKQKTFWRESDCRCTRGNAWQREIISFRTNETVKVGPLPVPYPESGSCVHCDQRRGHNAECPAVEEFIHGAHTPVMAGSR